jgi:hypothetical protein
MIKKERRRDSWEHWYHEVSLYRKFRCHRCRKLCVQNPSLAFNTWWVSLPRL